MPRNFGVRDLSLWHEPEPSSGNDPIWPIVVIGFVLAVLVGTIIGIGIFIS